MSLKNLIIYFAFIISVFFVFPEENNETKIIILADYFSANQDVQKGNGFSALIKTNGKTILFDTGMDGKTLLSNLKKLYLNPSEIDIIFLSHNHRDHTGGLSSILKENNKAVIYVPQSFLSDNNFNKTVSDYSAKAVPVTGSVEISKNIFTTGELKDKTAEQSLVVKTGKGLLLITGCAHPGIINILSRTKNIFQKNIYLVLGGFHLVDRGKEEIDAVLKFFRDSQIEYVSPTHCSGNVAIELFQKEYKDKFIAAGAGALITPDSLK
jgi:7,8-dihydropterin-6-yl-methyl-4-(beta-D-ribofuranosyl)aminobenzene 5'-phosphate synthase